MVALVAVGGSVAAYDHFPQARRFVAGLTAEKPAQTATSERQQERSASARPHDGQAVRLPTPVPPRPVGPPDQTQTAAIIPPAPIGKPGLEVMAQSAPARSGGALAGEGAAGAYEAKFFLCGTAKQDDCVVSADRFVVHGQKIRLVGIEVPDINKPHCEAERIKASDAKLRVRAFLDSGPFDLITWKGNDAQVEGHQLRDVTRNGRSLADVLVNEGLAKRPGLGKGGWCG
jgi:endonuclease YncB( thermonuclease family)